MSPQPISTFIQTHYRHFNAARLAEASEAYKQHVDKGGKMFLAMAGAMSTAELGLSLAEMIRKGKISAISCTGANLEEDVFNLVAHEHYTKIPLYRELNAHDEELLLAKGLNRVTDTCIPEEDAMRKIEGVIAEEWEAADKKGTSYFPHEYFYKILHEGKLKKFYQIDPTHSWMVAAAEKNLPIFTPGWEDSTLGNFFAARCISGKIKNTRCMKSGIDAMMTLADWYTKTSREHSVGFFQIGGGISGDFPICVVPMLHQDLKQTNVPVWGYFCQISDSTTSYGSYSGAIPNEKITWGKLKADTPRYIIESDATIVAPLVFAYVLGW